MYGNPYARLVVLAFVYLSYAKGQKLQCGSGLKKVICTTLMAALVHTWKCDEHDWIYWYSTSNKDRNKGHGFLVI